MSDVWSDIEKLLTQIYSFPHNQVYLQQKGRTLEGTVAYKMSEIRSGINGVPKAEIFQGPKTFLRVTGAANQVYGGEWWFEATVLDSLESGLSRLLMVNAELKKALTALLREVLAVSTEWNTMDEIWVLNLPPGQRLDGFSGFGNPQKLFHNKPLSVKGNRMLLGKVRQIYFPVKNPLWITKYRNLK